MKKDINLLYKRKSKQYSGKKLVIIMLAILFIGGALYFGITLPTEALANTKAAVSQLDSKLSENKDLDTQMLEKAREKKVLEEQLEGIKMISSAKSDVSEYVEIIEESLPREALVTQLSMSDESLEILGVAENDEILATFFLRLREKNVFSDLYVVSSTVLLGTDNTTMFRLTGTLPKSLSDVPLAEESEDGNTLTEETATQEDAQ